MKIGVWEATDVSTINAQVSQFEIIQKLFIFIYNRNFKNLFFKVENFCITKKKLLKCNKHNFIMRRLNTRYRKWLRDN